MCGIDATYVRVRQGGRIINVAVIIATGANTEGRREVLPGRVSFKQMGRHDFWNLVGRAGRWGDDFSGNIICVDVHLPKQWPNGVPAKSGYPKSFLSAARPCSII